MARIRIWKLPNGCSRLMTNPTNKTSSSKAAMRIQKPARGIAAVMCGGAGTCVAEPGATYGGGAAVGGTAPPAALDSGAAALGAAAAAPAGGAALAVHPAPAIVADAVVADAVVSCRSATRALGAAAPAA